MKRLAALAGPASVPVTVHPRPSPLPSHLGKRGRGSACTPEGASKPQHDRSTSPTGRKSRSWTAGSGKTTLSKAFIKLGLHHIKVDKVLHGPAGRLSPELFTAYMAVVAQGDRGSSMGSPHRRRLYRNARGVAAADTIVWLLPAQGGHPPTHRPYRAAGLPTDGLPAAPAILARPVRPRPGSIGDRVDLVRAAFLRGNTKQRHRIPAGATGSCGSVSGDATSVHSRAQSNATFNSDRTESPSTD